VLEPTGHACAGAYRASPFPRGLPPSQHIKPNQAKAKGRSHGPSGLGGGGQQGCSPGHHDVHSVVLAGSNDEAGRGGHIHEGEHLPGVSNLGASLQPLAE
jgi:hypothetical protein